MILLLIYVFAFLFQLSKGAEKYFFNFYCLENLGKPSWFCLRWLAEL